jgi:predicted neuraminidase
MSNVLKWLQQIFSGKQKEFSSQSVWTAKNPTDPAPFHAIRQEFIYSIGSIPDRPQAHASNIIQGPCSPDKITLYCAWFCGTREGNVDVAILFSIISYQPQTNLGEIKFEYTPPKVIADLPDRACGNPVLFYEPNGTLHLWFAGFVPRGSADPNRHIYYQQSKDGGNTWTNPKIISDRPGLWVRNNLVVLDDGTWLFPMNDETTPIPKYRTTWSSRFAWSRDHGQTWDFGDLWSCKKGMIQPSVVQFPTGNLFCVHRSRNGYIMASRSSDRGHTWTEAQSLDLPNPNSNVVQWLLPSGELLLVYNPTKKGRTPLSLAISRDSGHTWTRIADLQTILGEFSYPCIWQTPDGLIHITYTYRRQTISHDVIQM